MVRRGAGPGNPLPGFGAGLTITVAWLGILLIIPVLACVAKAGTLGAGEFFSAVWSVRSRAAYGLTFGTSAVAAVLDVIFGTLLAWVLVRYQFPGRRLMDAVIDLPLALPTAVAGLVYSGLYVKSGWLGQFLVPLGIQAAYSKLAIVLVLAFLGLPFVVRTIQPVLAGIEPELEEAAASRGAGRLDTFLRVLLPSLRPAMVTGGALAFARGLGEYGSVVFVSGNMPLRTEIAPVLIVQKLEEFSVAEATAIAVVLLGASLLALGSISWLESRRQTDAR
jgi:sulfate transport system permease protein